jgi:AcrR family transcriptional regulator
MLDKMTEADVSLNELSRRVGLAKSKVLRGFESREAVLLELLDDFRGRWLVDLTEELSAGIESDAAQEVRAGQLADILGRSLADHLVLCDLFGAQGGVLEHNVSVEVVKRHKRSSLAKLADMSELLVRYVPELGEGAQLFCLISLVSAGALASYVPPPSPLAAYAEERELGVLNLHVRQPLSVAFTSSLIGVLPRA